ncbi:nucleolin 2-like isoform X7, partial [Biomphalaria pfeifferi]
RKPGAGNDQQQNNAAVLIQTQYRQKEAKEEVQELRMEQAAIKIQSGFRGHMDREQVRKM